MECNFSQIQNYFKCSKYKEHPTIKITALPPSPTPTSLFNYKMVQPFQITNVKAGSQYIIMYIYKNTYFIPSIFIEKKSVY